MKNTARFAAVILAMTLSFSAFAKGQFDEAQRAMMDSQWGRAEQLLKAYQEKDYNNGKGHYLLAQVYEQTRRYAEAQEQLNIAKKVAPDGRWAKAGQAEAMANRLSIKLAANNPQPRTQERAPTRVAREEPRDTYVPPVRHTERTATTTPAPVTAIPEQKSSGGMGFLWAILILAAAGGGIYFYLQRREQKREEDERIDSIRAQQAVVVDMQDRVRELRQGLKYQKQESSELGLGVDTIASNLNTTANALRDSGVDLSRVRSNLSTIENQLSTAEGRLARKDFNKPAPAPTPAPAPRTAAPQPTPAPVYQRPPQPAYVAPVAPAPAPAPVQTVVHHHHETVVHDNSSDVLAAVVIADALASSREAEARLERERQRERDRDYERQREREREEERAEQRRREDEARREREEAEAERRNRYTPPAMDLGGDDDDDDNRRGGGSSSSWNDSSSSSSSDGPSMDFGGSDD